MNVSPTNGNRPTQGQRKTLTRVGIKLTTSTTRSDESNLVTSTALLNSGILYLNPPVLLLLLISLNLRQGRIQNFLKEGAEEIAARAHPHSPPPHHPHMHSMKNYLRPVLLVISLNRKTPVTFNVSLGFLKRNDLIIVIFQIWCALYSQFFKRDVYL